MSRAGHQICDCRAKVGTADQDYSLFPMSGITVDAHMHELKDYAAAQRGR